MIAVLSLGAHAHMVASRLWGSRAVFFLRFGHSEDKWVVESEFTPICFRAEADGSCPNHQSTGGHTGHVQRSTLPFFQFFRLLCLFSMGFVCTLAVASC